MNDTTYGVVLGSLFVVGLFLGRFLNRCIARLPEEFHVIPAWRKVFSKEKTFGISPAAPWYAFLPLIGTASIVGRSPYSGRRIRKREPWLELLNAFLTVGTFVCLYPPEAWGGPMNATVVTPIWAGQLYGWEELSPLFLWGRYFYFLFLVESLFVATFIDFDLWIIPDGSTVPGMVVGLVGHLIGLGFFLCPIWMQDPSFVEFSKTLIPILSPWPVEGYFPQWIFYNHFWHSLTITVVGFLVGGGSVWAVRIVGASVLKREAMGFGDVILMAMIGSFIGWQAVIIVFFLAALFALVIIGGITLLRSLSLVNFPAEIPYGPYLSLATLVTIACWDPLWGSFGQMFTAGPFIFVASAVMLIFLVVFLYLIQILKRLLGIEDWEEEHGSWRSADQLSYFSGNKIDPPQNHWQPGRTPTELAGRGQLGEHRWKDSCR